MKLAVGGSFKVDLKSYTNYYPYGMEQPQRAWRQGEDYRYGYNGVEEDDELKGDHNSTATEARLYDPRLGMWLGIDPIVYESQSPYSAMNGNPIANSDADGQDPVKGGEPITVPQIVVTVERPQTTTQSQGLPPGFANTVSQATGVTTQAVAENTPIPQRSPLQTSKAVHPPVNIPVSSVHKTAPLQSQTPQESIREYTQVDRMNEDKSAMMKQHYANEKAFYELQACFQELVMSVAGGNGRSHLEMEVGTGNIQVARNVNRGNGVTAPRKDNVRSTVVEAETKEKEVVNTLETQSESNPTVEGYLKSKEYVKNSFDEHAFSKDHPNDDIGLSKEAISDHVFNFVESNEQNLVNGHNFYHLYVNGVNKVISVVVKNKAIFSVNFYNNNATNPRKTTGVINLLGNTTWK